MGARVLIVEDDPDIGAELARIIGAAGHDCDLVTTVPSAVKQMRSSAYDAVLLDLGLPGEEGISALEHMVKHNARVRVVVLTGRDEAALAIAAIRAGAFDYLVKPWRREVLMSALNRAIAAKGSDPAARREGAEDSLVGQSDLFRTVIEQARLAAETSRVPVLLCGECGTGKDVIGKEIHRWSTHAKAPFVTINAACLPGSLLESELFGHEAGAFTDAKTPRRGLFEQAHGGTLFLDEIGELPLDLQPKLLRVLEGHSFRRLGGEREIRTDVRLVAATNRRLPEMISRGLFREDLYYRLSVFELVIPPLRERGTEDIRKLTDYFLTKTARDMERPTPTIAPRALEHLLAYPWPGNVRELRNVIERAVVLSRGEQLDLEHLPVDVRGVTPRRVEPLSPTGEPAALDPSQLSLDAAMRTHVLRVYEHCGRNLTHAATALGITRVSLRKRLRAYGIYPVKNYTPVSI